MLRARGLVKTYRAPAGPRIRVLDGVDVDVRRGDLVVIAGASGSGKSTLLNVLGLLEDTDAGEVWFDGERVSALGRSARSRARGRFVGFVFQSFLLLPSLTALDNVVLAARYVDRGGADPRRRGSGWPSAAPCSTTRRCSWPTSRPVTSTTPTLASSSGRCGGGRLAGVPSSSSRTARRPSHRQRRVSGSRMVGSKDTY
ncbi:MAG: hypothetical protein AUH30_07975 [Candidatus Rokubacteria bacterium 13_1_40CM_68_15]|nr:MAG: hypothetical protein AUH30_07975 [Candidatus Rokubacteria bacterium 13_1_40CM_68_15]